MHDRYAAVLHQHNSGVLHLLPPYQNKQELELLLAYDRDGLIFVIAIYLLAVGNIDSNDIYS